MDDNRNYPLISDRQEYEGPTSEELQEETPEPDVHCVTLQSPGSGFWMLQVMEGEAPLQHLAKEAVQSVQQDYEEVEVDEAQEDLEGVSLGGYDLQFYCLDFLVSARTLAVRAANQTYLMIWQAEDREFTELEPVFRAITTSLFENVAQAIRSAGTSR